MQYAGSAAYLGTISGLRVVSVAYRVTAAGNKTVIKRHKPVRISGSVAPGHGVRVVLQRRVGKRWVSTSSGRTNLLGRYVFSVRPRKAGTAIYRVFAKRGDAVAVGYSPHVAFHVRR